LNGFAAASFPFAGPQGGTWIKQNRLRVETNGAELQSNEETQPED
jgi:hypothetical protein